MTSRPGRAALDVMRMTRNKTLCHVVKVIPKSLPPIRLTDHDREITFEGELYTPISFGGMSADRREAAFRSGNQEIRGSIDGSTITLPQLDANRYRGAEVRQVVIDWKHPWLVFARHRKWIRSIVRDGSTFIGTIEARTQSLQRPNAGRFGGSFTTNCIYELGDPTTCKKDIAQWEFVAQVDAVIDGRRSFEFNTSHFPNNDPATAATFIDDFYREGSVEWLYGPSTAGAAWTGLTTTTLTDSGASWTTDEHAGRYIIVGDENDLVHVHALVVSNTATVVTFVQVDAVSAVSGSYAFADSSAISGTVSPIISHVHSNRQIDLLIPTPADIPAGSWGILRPGCDGLLTTCRIKFANQLNFGGDPFSPSSVQIIEPVDDSL